ncbi:hypothetical protein EV356DRAFT_447999 [Viridothelium virens]|uniref:Cyclin-dependent kinase n=1 Tax=Viridothelium virens TaxID=1048519 RepID=A0A6A6H8D7_VIRVR|nr:hypothetical protein EV356DRAFT_447999 [Viridothelium virens]
MDHVEQAGDVANKVLKRAQVSKMTRALQDRLALANLKVKNGWEHLSIEKIEEKELKRKRPTSSNDTLSDSSSSVSDRFHFSSSPLTAPMFSDGLTGSGGSMYGQTKRSKYQQQIQRPASASYGRRRLRSANHTKPSWKSTFQLPESSPVKHNRYDPPKSSKVSNFSFVSNSSTIPDELSPSISDDDDEQDLPTHSFQLNSSQIHSSPPCTPPPGGSRQSRLLSRSSQNVTMSRTPKTGEEGADLLLFLATSPSPAHPSSASNTNQKTRVYPPSTPPTKHTPLPSSMMSTPGGPGSAFLGFGLNTPSQNFNFADFVNITPSPAQGPWSRTPTAAASARTPLAAREARRKLNFSPRLPPGASPGLGAGLERGKGDGLGMELGGELVN